MAEKGKEFQAVEIDGVDEERRGLLKKAASLVGVIGLAGLTEFAATTEAAAICNCDGQCGVHRRPKPMIKRIKRKCAGH
jgi:hypothetical protein